MMETKGNDAADSRRPLAITITTAGREHVLVRSLLQQAVPMLANPEAYSAHQRRQLAQSLLASLELEAEDDEEAGPDFSDSDAPPEPDEFEYGYELSGPIWQ